MTERRRAHLTALAFVLVGRVANVAELAHRRYDVMDIGAAPIWVFVALC